MSSAIEDSKYQQDMMLVDHETQTLFLPDSEDDVKKKSTDLESKLLEFKRKHEKLTQKVKQLKTQLRTEKEKWLRVGRDWKNKYEDLERTIKDNTEYSYKESSPDDSVQYEWAGDKEKSYIHEKEVLALKERITILEQNLQKAQNERDALQAQNKSSKRQTKGFPKSFEDSQEKVGLPERKAKSQNSKTVRQENTERKVLQDIETCFTPTDNLVLEVYAPWIEEAINNIKHIDMKQTQAKPGRQKIAEIKEENLILKREREKLRITFQELEKSSEHLRAEHHNLKTAYTTLYERYKKANSDEIKNNTTSNEYMGLQQTNPQPDQSQEQYLSDTIPEITEDEERRMKWINKLETLRGQVKALEEEKKKLQDELSRKEITILQLRDDVKRRPERPKSAYPTDHRAKGRSASPRSAYPIDQHVQADCERHCNEMDAFKKKLKHCEHLITFLKEEKLNNEKTINGLRAENNELLNRKELDILKKDLTDMNSKVKHLQEENKELIYRKETWKAQASKLKREMDLLKKDRNEEKRKYEENVQRNREQIKQLEEDNNELLNRMSSQAEARITRNNPYDTVLSDQNRPTKISERYSELYDNQWTDAFELLQTKHHLSDSKAIEVLLDVLSVSFDECKEARRLHEGLLKALKGYIGEDEDSEDVTILEVMRTLKGTKRNIKKMQEEFNQHVHSKLTTKKFYQEILPDIRPYMDECVEICLLMNIQEPPVELRGLELLSGSAFDLSAFQSYTESGNKIKYIVWPAMYLYQNGPLLRKGVAQGMSDSSNVLKPTDTHHDATKNEFTTEVI